MDITVSIKDHRSISQSELIMRKLMSILQIGKTNHVSTNVFVDAASFRSGTAEHPLVLTLKNSQTETVMYVRNIPISAVLSHNGPFEQWVAVYPPGDPQNLHFDIGSMPKKDCPQVLVSIRIQEDFGVPSGMSPSAREVGDVGRPSFGFAPGPREVGAEQPAKVDELRRSVDSLQAELSKARLDLQQRDSMGGEARPSMGRATIGAVDNTVREKEMQALRIKERVAEMANAQKRSQDMSRSLQENMRIRDDLRRQLKSLEMQLAELRAGTQILEKDRDQLRAEETQLLEQIRQRDIAFQELKESRDEIDRELNRALSEREMQKMSMETSTKNFSLQTQTMVTDIDQSRRQVQNLSTTLKERESMVQQIEQDVRDAQRARSAKELAAREDIRTSLDRTRRDVEDSRAELEDKKQQQQNLALTHQEIKARLEGLKREVAELSGDLGTAAVGAQASAELAAKKDKLEAHTAKVRNLEGQLQDNREQLAEMSAKMAELHTEAKEKELAVRRCEDVRAELQRQLEAQRHNTTSSVASRQAAEEQLKRAEQELEQSRLSLDTLEKTFTGGMERASKEATELESGVNQRQEELSVVRKEIADLNRTISELDTTSAGKKASAREKSSALEAARAKAAAVSKKLAETTDEVAGSEGQLKRMTMDAETYSADLTELQKRTRERREAAAALEDEAARKAETAKAEIDELERTVAVVRGDLEQQREAASSAQQRVQDVQGSLADRQQAVSDLERQIEQLTQESTQWQNEHNDMVTQHDSLLAELRQGADEITSHELAVQAREKDLNSTRLRISARLARTTQMEMEHKNDLAKLEADVERLTNEQQESEREQQKLQAEYASLQAQCASGETYIAQKEKEQAEMSAELEKLMQEHTRLRGDGETALAQQTLQVKDAQERAQKAAELAKQKQERLREVEQKHKTVSTQLATIQEEADGEGAALQNALAELESKCASFAKLQAELDEQQRLATDLESTGRALDTQTQTLATQLVEEEREASKVPGLQARYNELLQEQRAEDDRHAEEVARRTRDISDLQSELQQRQTDLQKKKAAEIAQQTDQIRRLESEKLSLTESLGQIDGDSKEMSATLDGKLLALRQLEAESSATEQEIQSLERTLREATAGAEAARQQVDLVKSLAESEPKERILRSELADMSSGLRVAQFEATAAVAEAEGEVIVISQKLKNAKEANAAQRARNAEYKEELARLKEEETKLNGECAHLDSRAAELEEAVKRARAKLAEAAAERQRQQSMVSERLRCVKQSVNDKEHQMQHSNGGVKSDVQVLEDRLQQVNSMLAEALEKVRKQRAQEEELRGEIQRTKDMVQATHDKMAHQMEHGNLQFETIQKLEEQKQRFEGEVEVLTIGLHEAEQRNSYLQEENQLLQKRIEGLYQGSLTDWATESRKAQVDAEVSHFRAEIEKFKQKAEQTRKEKQLELQRRQRKHEETVNELRDKIGDMERQIAQCERTVQKHGASNAQQHGAQVSPSSALLGLAVPQRPLPANHQRRRALLVGANYVSSHAPLKGCVNDIWSLQCLLRHTLRYGDDQLRLLLDGADGRQTRADRLATKANMIAGLQWLISGAQPGDNLMFVFCGYGAQHPRSPGLPDHEAYLVPSDFGADMPPNFFSASPQPVADPRMAASHGYRLLALAELNEFISRLPAGCHMTVMLDCCYSVLPTVSPVSNFSPTFPRVDRGRVDYAKLRDFISRPRFLELPVLPISHTPAHLRNRVMFPSCTLHCFSACRLREWCGEFPIEGTVQGAFSWSFLKALARGHFHCGIYQFLKDLATVLADLKLHFKGVEQTPVLQLSQPASTQDVVLWT
eukprot:TRINITY_DN59342_c0_g1_i1.p1 TRINITY_DN59342_c0_g1~~TRINITY_DN59342_c0_g1_i1.p1  ORF type:complete len:1827 (+),score=630.77 TRINITY_DN59342_c0_g1_i1:155-5635(+)